MKISDRITKVETRPDYLLIETGGSKIQLYLLDDDIVRFRCCFDPDFPPEHSYTLVKTAWEDELDELLAGERTRVTPIPPSLIEEDEYYLLETASLRIKLFKDPFGIEIRDENDTVLYQDLRERSFLEDSLGRRYHYSVMNPGDHFYGFGEKTGYLNKRLDHLRMHNTDTCGHDPEKSDPLYKHIPFHIRFNDQTNKAVGLFYHNGYDCAFDLGREWSGYWQKYTYYQTDGGEVDLFFINGPTIAQVVQRFTDLTGKTALPPLSATGYGHTTMFYTEIEKDADQEILKFVERCKKEGIPLDAFWIASGYACMPNGKRYQFHWNKDKFPNPAGFISQMQDKGVEVIPNVKPGILTTHPDYEEFAKAGAFIRDEGGQEPHTERYWGGFASFPDFSNPQARKVWEKHLREALLDKGIGGIWDDNCEFDIQNGDAVIENEGAACGIAAHRPTLGNLMALSSFNALREAHPERRPYVISRAGGAGIQRYAQTWAGDNLTSWRALRFNLPTILNMGLSGAANHGCDIGGWFGQAPDPELLVRWFQCGVFMPRFLTNSANTDNSVTEPYMYPSVTKKIAAAVQLRYALTPLMYALLYQAATVGDPVMRPLVYGFANDARCHDESFEFLFGSDLLVAPVLEPGANEWEVYLPAGTDWYDYWTHRRYRGGQTITLPVDLDTIPMFFRQGAIIPSAPGLKNLHNQPIKKLNLLVESSRTNQFVHYEDDGISTQYQQDDYLATTFSVEYKEDGQQVQIKAEREGDYQSRIETVEMEIVNTRPQPYAIELVKTDGAGADRDGGEPTGTSPVVRCDADDRAGGELRKFLDPSEWEEAESGWYFDMENHCARLRFPNPGGEYRVVLNYGLNDLVKM